MTSLVNGEAIGKTAMKKNTQDELPLIPPEETKSPSNKQGSESKETLNLQNDKPSDCGVDTAILDNQSCINLTEETNDDSSEQSKSKDILDKNCKNACSENGTHCLNSDEEKSADLSSEKKENEEKKSCVSHPTKEKNIHNNSSDSSVTEKKYNFITPEDKEKNKNDLKSTEADKSFVEKENINDESVESNKESLTENQNNSTSESKQLLEKVSSKCVTAKGKLSLLEEQNDSSMVVTDEMEEKLNECDDKIKSDSISGTYTQNTICLNSNETLDLSVTKDKDSDHDRNVLAESNPLEKLNEHLNSIGCNENSRITQNMSPKISASKPVTPKTDNLSNNKENKNVSSHTLDRFKESPDNFVFAELSNEETGFPEVFTGLVKIGRYISVKGDFTLRSTEALVESPSLVSSYLLKEPDSFPPKEKDTKSESRDYFHSAAGEILIGIGLSRVNEWYHKDMVRIKKRQMKREGKRPHLEEELTSHEANFTEAKKANNVYSYKYKVCKTCGFTTESSIVMEGHLLVPHLTQRREYQCNYCSIIDRDPKLMLDHMEKEHKKIGRIQPPVLFFECPYCTFESNSKVKLNNHLLKCQRYFDPGVNQAPPRDFEFPALTPKPITVAVVKAYEKSLGSMQRGRGRPKKTEQVAALQMNQISPSLYPTHIAPNNLTNYKSNSSSPLVDGFGNQNQVMSPMQISNLNIRPAHMNSASSVHSNIPPVSFDTPNRIYQFINSSGQAVPIVGNNHSTTSPFPFTPNLINSGKKILPSGSPYFNSSPFVTGLHSHNPSKNIPEMKINALPKLTGPYPAPVAKHANQLGNSSKTGNNLVMCEICDGYIKDLDQLRTHMQLIHKVKIHPKMLASRPPLNCQKCQWRFFTDQGLERHLLGAHGLVTSNMQELANKNKDAGCCTICGRVYASKLVNHMNQIHKITLKPAHLSYKCTVCSATFNLYRLFENHVYLVHSGAAKRSSESGRSSPTKRLRTVADKGDSSSDHNNTDKKGSNEVEEFRICIECGDDILSNKPDCKKCEKCLKSDELIQGTLSTKTAKDELKKKDKTIEKAA